MMDGRSGQAWAPVLRSRASCGVTLWEREETGTGPLRVLACHRESGRDMQSHRRLKVSLWPASSDWNHQWCIRMTMTRGKQSGPTVGKEVGWSKKEERVTKARDAVPSLRSSGEDSVVTWGLGQCYPNPRQIRSHGLSGKLEFRGIQYRGLLALWPSSPKCTMCPSSWDVFQRLPKRVLLQRGLPLEMTQVRALESRPNLLAPENHFSVCR